MLSNLMGDNKLVHTMFYQKMATRSRYRSPLGRGGLQGVSKAFLFTDSTTKATRVPMNTYPCAELNNTTTALIYCNSEHSRYS